MSEGYATEEYSSKKGNLAQSHKRAHDDSSKKHEGGKPILKVLIPNFFAGDIIGKQGAKRLELEAQYQCKIKFSPNKTYYPGTDQRIVSFSADSVEDLKGVHAYIIEALEADSIKDAENYNNEHNKEKKVVKIVCPHTAAGLIIGSGGAEIKTLQEETGAKVVVSRQGEATVPTERIVRISGSVENRIEAAKRVCDTIAAHPENIRLGYNLDYSSGTNEGTAALNNYGPPMNKRPFNGQQQQRGPNFGGPGGYGGGFGGGFGSGAGFGGNNNSQNNGGMFATNNVSQIETAITVKMKIPEILVGTLMGNQSQTLREVIDFSGAQIQLTPRNEYGPRVLTIDGDAMQSKSAHFLINQKIQRALDAMNQAF